MLLCYAFQNLYAFYEDVIIYGRRQRQINLTKGLALTLLLTKVQVLVSKSHFRDFW